MFKCFVLNLTIIVFRLVAFLNLGTGVRVVNAMLDTGSVATVISVDHALYESVQNVRTRTFYGVNKIEFLAKEMTVPQFTLENLDLRETQIWIVDKDVPMTQNLVGMDILSKLTFSYNPVMQELTVDGHVPRKADAMLLRLCPEYGIDPLIAKQLLLSHWSKMSEYELRDCLTFIKGTFN